MRRIAVHRVFWKELLRLQVIELTEEGVLIDVFPLTEELPGTEFRDGLWCLLPLEVDDSFADLEALRKSGVTERVSRGSFVRLRQLPDSGASAEFTADNGGRNRHVQ